MTRARQLIGHPSRPGVAAVLFLLVFLVTIAARQQLSQTGETEGRRKELAHLVEDRERHITSLTNDLSRLQGQAEALAAKPGSPLVSIQGELDRVGLSAGTAPVKGRGLVVTLSDSTLANSGQQSRADFMIQDVDLQLVVNELWNDGAEAIAINGQRIVGTTAIRSAGQTILVNYRVLISPYRVEAIGDPKAMRDRLSTSSVAQHFATWTEVYRLGFSFAVSDRVHLPAFQGTLRFRYATPATP